MEKPHTPTQTELILDYMREYGSITPIEALTECGCLRLSARIYDLKQCGHAIASERIKVIGKRTGHVSYPSRYTLHK